MYTKLLTLATLLTCATLASAKPTVYLIRHGEKPEDGGIGLSSLGKERAECLRSVFGAESGYNIGYIMAQTPKENGKRVRAFKTVLPLSNDLGIKVDKSCDRDDPECVKDAVDSYDGDGNVLICWEHDALTDIVEELGVEDGPEYPSDRFDLIWTLPDPYDEITGMVSEECPGLDS